MATFAANFRAGDVIYGRREARERYVDTLAPGVKKLCDNAGAWLTCDDFNNRSWIGEGRVGASTLSEADIDANVDLYTLGGVVSMQQARAVRKFYEAICADPGRSPKAALSADERRLEKHDKGSLYDLQIRRACKFGIHYVLFELKKQVHFVLDDPRRFGQSMDMRDIVDKGRISLPSGEFVPITTSELRCCYRNRQEWLGTGRLKFYLDLQEVPPPWLTNPKLWAEYDQHRNKKHMLKAFRRLLPVGR